MKQEALDRVRTMFEVFDANGNGVLEADDFALMSSRLRTVVDPAQEGPMRAMDAALQRYWTVLSTELDANRDGRITLAEFTACVLAPERFSAAAGDIAESLSRLSDPDGDGLIDRRIFVDLLVAAGFPQANAEASFDALAPSESDQITVQDYDTTIRDFYHPERTGIASDHLVSTASARA